MSESNTGSKIMLIYDELPQFYSKDGNLWGFLAGIANELEWLDKAALSLERSMDIDGSNSGELETIGKFYTDVERWGDEDYAYRNRIKAVSRIEGGTVDSVKDMMETAFEHTGEVFEYHSRMSHCDQINLDGWTVPWDHDKDGHFDLIITSHTAGEIGHGRLLQEINRFKAVGTLGSFAYPLPENANEWTEETGGWMTQTHTSQSDFEAGTESHINTSSWAGDVRLAETTYIAQGDYTSFIYDEATEFDSGTHDGTEAPNLYAAIKLDELRIESNRTSAIIYDLGVITASEMTTICGMSYDGTYMWMVDEVENYVFSYTPAGNLSSYAGDGAGSFSGGTDPRSVACDGAYVWVGDISTDYVKSHTYDGEISSYAGDGVGSFSFADAMNITSDGTNLWISKYTDSDRVFEVDSTGALQSSFLPGYTMRGLTHDGSYLFGVAHEDPTIKTHKTDGTLLGSFALTTSFYGALDFDGTYFRAGRGATANQFGKFLPNYPTSGNWITSNIDGGTTFYSWSGITWSEDLPDGGDVNVKYRTATSEGGLTTAEWSSFADGDSSPTEIINESTNRWLSANFQLTASNSSFTPVLDDIKAIGSDETTAYCYHSFGYLQSSIIDGTNDHVVWDNMSWTEDETTGGTLNLGYHTCAYNNQSSFDAVSYNYSSTTSATISVGKANRYLQWKGEFESDAADQANNSPLLSDVTLTNWIDYPINFGLGGDINSDDIGHYTTTSAFITTGTTSVQFDFTSVTAGSTGSVWIYGNLSTGESVVYHALSESGYTEVYFDLYVTGDTLELDSNECFRLACSGDTYFGYATGACFDYPALGFSEEYTSFGVSLTGWDFISGSPDPDMATGIAIQIHLTGSTYDHTIYLDHLRFGKERS